MTEEKPDIRAVSSRAEPIGGERPTLWSPENHEAFGNP